MTLRHAGTWLRRYGPAELLAVVGALVGYALVELLTSSAAAAAYGAAVGDNLAYYGLLLAREARVRGVAAAAPALVVEFGPAEVLDTALVRPACMALAVSAFGPALGVVVAKCAADLVFYVPVIVTYEASRAKNAMRGSRDASSVGGSHSVLRRSADRDGGRHERPVGLEHRRQLLLADDGQSVLGADDLGDRRLGLRR